MIILKHRISGELKKWGEEVPYSARDWEAIDSTANEDKIKLETALDEAGIKWGDAIAWVTKRLGVHQCAPCKARQEILNHMGVYGISETIRLLKETAHG